MTTTLDLPDDLVEDVQLRASQEGRKLDETVADLLRAGLASSIRASASFHVSASMLAERKRLGEKFLTGEWGVELAGFEGGRAADRESAVIRDKAWRR
jgi:plasmid stability protein